MDGGRKGNCSFSSYISNENGSSDARQRTAERKSYESRWGEKHRGIFKEVRNLRREDERRLGRRNSLNRVSFTARREGASGAQAAKFAVLLACICVFSLIFALKMAKSDLPAESLAVFRSAMSAGTEDEDDDERLGRLHLVQLPGLLSVFAASDSPVAPLNSEQAITDDNFTAKLFSTKGTEVISMLSGTVRSVDPKGEHGGSVTVACKNGVEITYMGLDEILVERGQPVLQRTVLGRLGGEMLYLRVTKDGKPIDPIEFLGTAARVG